MAEVEASDLFDGGWYLRRYPEAVRDRVAPAVHLVRHGNEQGLDPSELFGTRAHLDAHPEAGGPARAGPPPPDVGLSHRQRVRPGLRSP